MPLPKLDVPVYDTVLPSGTRVQYRSFLVKEEKLFLIAAQSDDAETIIANIKQVLSNCLISGPPIEDLPIFDVEYLLLQIRARSVGEVVSLRYKCNAQITKDDGSKSLCGVKSDYDINLVDFKPTTFPEHTKTIMLTNTVGVVMQYPLFSRFSKALLGDFTADDAIDILMNCIESIFDEHSVHYVKDIPKQELLDFIESLSPQQLKKLDNFFDTLPKNILTIQFKCPSCQHTETIEAKGIDNFFV